MNVSNAALLVPPVRLGRLLSEVRESQGRTARDLSRGCGLAYDEAWFDDLEAGRVPLDEPLVRWVSALYGVDASELAPSRSRLIVDLDEGVISVGAKSVTLSGSSHVPAVEQVLTNYLALIYLLRGIAPGTPIPLREVDVDVLSHAVQRNRRDVQHALGRLVAGESAAVATRSAHLRRRVVVPVAGILVSLTAIGGLLLVRSSDSDARPDEAPVLQTGSSSVARSLPASGASTATVPVEIGDAVVLERGGAIRTR